MTNVEKDQSQKRIFEHKVLSVFKPETFYFSAFLILHRLSSAHQQKSREKYG